MSGHSKWATIKRKKGASDARRGQAFTKLANAIALAARDGADPERNFKLRLAIDKAKAANMPNANIERSIARGSGQTGGARIEEVLYEGYGPGGIAVVVESATDNRNRTSADVRTVFSKQGGRLAETGAVVYQFDRRGVLTLETHDLETATLASIDAGAEDVLDDEGSLVIYTQPSQLNAVRSQLTEAGYTAANAELIYAPKQTIQITDATTAQKVLNLMNALDELDDVTNTYSNFDIPSEVLGQTL